MEIKAYDIGTKVYIIGIKSEKNKKDYFDIISDGIVYKILIDDKGLRYGIKDAISSFSMIYYDEPVIFDSIMKATDACKYYNENYDKIKLDKRDNTKDED